MTERRARQSQQLLHLRVYQSQGKRIASHNQIKQASTDASKFTSCSPNSVSCPTSKRDAFLRTTRCQVPGTNTVLLIETGTRSVTPFRVKELLLDARRTIARKLLEMGGVDRHLFIWEVPFKSAAWGLEMVVDPAPGPSSRDVLLTWRMLEETTAGLLVCVYDRGPFFELQAIITREDTRGILESMGTLHLRRVVPASAAAFKGKRDIRTI
ncbi:MAG: hypothetical protein Q9180_007489, partial [Flavoplaca navasiana]